MAATVNPASRPVAPTEWASVVRLSERQLTYPPHAELSRLAIPSARSSRFISPSRRVAISTPVMLSKRLIVVTNITANTSPVSHGSAVHGKVRSSAGCQGDTTEAVGCDWNIQPATCASASENPAIGSATWIANKAATRIAGRTKAFVQRDRSACKMKATASPAASLAMIAPSANVSMVASFRR